MVFSFIEEYILYINRICLFQRGVFQSLCVIQSTIEPLLTKSKKDGESQYFRISVSDNQDFN